MKFFLAPEFTGSPDGTIAFLWALIIKGALVFPREGHSRRAITGCMVHWKYMFSVKKKKLSFKISFKIYQNIYFWKFICPVWSLLLYRVFRYLWKHVQQGNFSGSIDVSTSYLLVTWTQVRKSGQIFIGIPRVFFRGKG